MMLDGLPVVDVEVDGVTDYPDFADAFISYAVFEHTGDELDADQLYRLQEQNKIEFWWLCDEEYH